LNTLTDQQLLRDYAQHRSDVAFAELVRRHVDHVYSAALRMAREAHMAEDVTQGVFVVLAQNARKLADHPALSGWLQRTARNLAGKTVRSHVRRRIHEQEAVDMNELLATEPNAVWEQIAPHLDAALSELSRADHDVLTLRYFERKSAREMAKALGTSDEAAQKRVNRAVDRLRTLLAGRGIAVGGTGLALLLSANVVQSAPLSLCPTIAASVTLSGTVLHNATTVGISKALAMTTLQKILVISVVAFAVGTGVYGSRQISLLRTQVTDLRGQQQPLALQAEEWQRQRDEATKHLAAAEKENARLRRETAEVPRLRGEVSALRQTVREQASTESTAGFWAARIALLKQKLDHMPDKRIPELEFLTDKDWAAATRDAELETEDGVRQAMSALRSAAKDNFLRAMRDAIKKYIAAASGGALPGDPAQLAQAVNANGALLPSDLAHLKPYFDSPVDDTTLQRYQLLRPKGLHDNLSDILVKEVAPPVDTEYDTHHEMGLDSGGLGKVNLIADAVAAAANGYARANNGQMPSEPAQIAPYLKQPLAAALIQKYLGKLPASAAVPAQ
jgi:RNA polymerase sigma factor (sigma-70 family)